LKEMELSLTTTFSEKVQGIGKQKKMGGLLGPGGPPKKAPGIDKKKRKSRKCEEGVEKWPGSIKF